MSDYGQVTDQFDSTRPIYPLKFLLLQTIMIEVSLYYCDKQILAQIHTSLCYIYCYLATLYLVWHLKKWPNDNKYNSGLCVLVLKFAYLSQQ